MKILLWTPCRLVCGL